MSNINFSTLFSKGNNSALAVEQGKVELNNTLARFNDNDLAGFNNCCYALAEGKLYFKFIKGATKDKHSAINGDKVRINNLALGLDAKANKVLSLVAVEGQPNTYYVEIA